MILLSSKKRTKSNSFLNMASGLNIQAWVRLGILLSALLAVAVQASPLDDARNAGQVMEMPNGYIMAKGSPTADIKALVKDINSRRKAAYEKIAKKNGISVEQVARESYRKRQP